MDYVQGRRPELMPEISWRALFDDVALNELCLLPFANKTKAVNHGTSTFRIEPGRFSLKSHYLKKEKLEIEKYHEKVLQWKD